MIILPRTETLDKCTVYLIKYIQYLTLTSQDERTIVSSLSLTVLHACEPLVVSKKRDALFKLAFIL